jgi:hypothetical protein
MSNKKISWVPMYDDVKNFASTRIRLFYPNNSINQYHNDKYESRIGFDINSDILIIQKKIDLQTLSYVKSFEGLVIFDFDDPVHNNSLFSEMMDHVDLITTDTLGRKEHFDSLNTGKMCYVIEDCLDYGIVDLYETPNVENSVSWFGNYPNVSSIEWTIPHIFDCGFGLNLITDSRHLRVPNPITITQWNLDTFVHELRKSNICLLSHKGSDSGVKSNNKMIVSIASGVPCIVNESRSYEELSKEFNLEYCIGNDMYSLKSALRILNSKEKRKDYLKEIQPYIINSLSTKVITEKLINLIKEHA